MKGRREVGEKNEAVRVDSQFSSLVLLSRRAPGTGAMQHPRVVNTQMAPGTSGTNGLILEGAAILVVSSHFREWES